MAQGLNYRLYQTSLVLLANDVNAGGINPDYLEAKGMVLGEWDWGAPSNTLSTPIASVVTYENGTNILAKSDRFQTLHDEDGFDPTIIKIDFIADRYIEANPDLHYSSIGTNFHIAMYEQDVHAFFTNRLIRDEVITDLGFDEVRTVELISKSDDKNIAIHFNPGTAKEGEEEINVLLVRGNFERGCSGYPASERVREFVSKFKDDWEEFQVLLNKIFIRE